MDEQHDKPRSLWELAAEPMPPRPEAASTPDDGAAGSPSEPAEEAPSAERRAQETSVAEPPRPRILARVLDVSRGMPAGGVPVVFETIGAGGVPAALGTASTDVTGLAALDWAPTLERAYYRLTFDVSNYFASNGVRSCYPVVSVLVQLDDPSRDFEVPLLLSPNGYSTYHA